jgi:hypothetical protein
MEHVREALVYLPDKAHKAIAQCLVLAARTLQLDRNGHHLLLHTVQLCHHTEECPKLSPHLLLITGPVDDNIWVMLFSYMISLSNTTIFLLLNKPIRYHCINIRFYLVPATCFEH